MRVSKTQALGFFAVGALAGVAFGFLTAPKSGAETRKAIGEVTRKRLDQANELGYEIRQHAHDLTTQVGDAIGNGVAKGREFTAAGRSRVAGVLGKVRQEA